MEIENGFLRVREPRQRALLRVLAFADRHRIAAAPLVEQLACEFHGEESRLLRQLAALLAAGAPVVNALQQVHGAVDETTLLALRLAEETGTLTSTYELCLHDDSDARFQTDNPLYAPTTQLLRRAVGIFIACLVLTFLGLFIIPTFVKMMDEFGLQMPPLPMRLFELYEKFGYFLVLFSLLSIVWIILFALRLRDWQWQPWKAVYPRRPATVRLRALLALAIGAGHSVVAAIETLTRFQGAFAIRSRLVAARERIQSGDEPWSALAQQKLLQPREAQALSLAPDRLTQQWLLQQTAVASAHRQETLRSVVLQSVSFFLLVLLAVTVGMTAISFFMVLTELITGLT